MIVANNPQLLDDVIEVKSSRGKKSIFSRINKRIIKTIFPSKIDNSLGPFSEGKDGIGYLDKNFFSSADIIHLHVINNFLTIDQILLFKNYSKPIVWTCHDNWPFTGGCHVRYDCKKYEKNCFPCQYLKGKSNIAEKLLNKKKKILDLPIYMTAPSKWMVSNISTSMFRNRPIYVLPNCIDEKVFMPRDKNALRDLLGLKKTSIVIGFFAMNPKTPYKGFTFLRDMLVKFENEKKDEIKNFEILVIGADSVNLDVKMSVHCMGNIKNQFILAECYAACDIIITPSIEESFSNVVMESISSGVPVLAFRTCAIPELIEHKKNGYLANLKDTDDLCNGFLWLLENIRNENLSVFCRKKVESFFTSKIIAEQAVDIYKKILTHYTR